MNTSGKLFVVFLLAMAVMTGVAADPAPQPGWGFWKRFRKGWTEYSRWYYQSWACGRRCWKSNSPRDIEDGNGRITKISIVKNGNDVVVTSVSSSKSEIPSIPNVLPLATPTNSTIPIKNSSSPSNNTNKNNSSINTSNAVQINSSRATLPNKTNDNVPSKIPTNSSNAVNPKQTNITSNSSSQSISIKKNTSNSSISISVSVNSNGSPVLPMKPIAPTPVESVNYPQGISLTVSSNNKSVPLLITIQNNTVKMVGINATSKNGVVSAQNGASNQVSLSVSINKPGSVSASASSKADSSPKRNIPTVLKDVWYEDDWDMDDE